MVAPMRVDGQIVGVLNARAGAGKGRVEEEDLKIFETVALLMGKSVQSQQLRAVLDSRFAQLALASEMGERVGGSIAATAYQNPDQLAKILAKSLYKEMAKAGFAPAQIISAASEIIEQLNAQLRRHSERASRLERREDEGHAAES
jgi:L-methionine (R)-S-oxide reductase